MKIESVKKTFLQQICKMNNNQQLILYSIWIKLLILISHV